MKIKKKKDKTILILKARYSSQLQHLKTSVFVVFGFIMFSSVLVERNFRWVGYTTLEEAKKLTFQFLPITNKHHRNAPACILYLFTLFPGSVVIKILELDNFF